MFWYFNPHFRKGSDDRCICYVVENKYFNPHFRKGSDFIGSPYLSSLSHFNPHFRKGSDVVERINALGFDFISIHTSAREVTKPTPYEYARQIFQSTLPQGKWLQYFTKTSVYFYEISINIFEFTFVYYWNTLSIQKAHSNLFIFTGASLPVILCMLDTRTCKL